MEVKSSYIQCHCHYFPVILFFILNITSLSELVRPRVPFHYDHLINQVYTHTRSIVVLSLFPACFLDSILN
uniref:Uncharacterized protein n=1 Tax=Oryza brachyantha TaxID=4533 RepID=J3KZU4_ORYBR